MKARLIPTITLVCATASVAEMPVLPNAHATRHIEGWGERGTTAWSKATAHQ